MKFENGQEQQYLEDKKMAGKSLNFFEKYLDFNRAKVPEVLEKRSLEQARLIEEQEKNIKEMEKAANRGKLTFKRK